MDLNKLLEILFGIISINSEGAKSQFLSSVAPPPRKTKLVTIFGQGHVMWPQKPMFTKFSVVNFL